MLQSLQQLQHSAKDKTVIQLEGQNNTETTTLYRIIRKIESDGNTDIGISYAKISRPEDRQTGEPDKLNVEITMPYDFVLSAEPGSTRDSHTNKTIFGTALNRNTFPTKGLMLVQRFRWVQVGKNLKPTKQYVVTRVRIPLTAGKPKQM